MCLRALLSRDGLYHMFKITHMLRVLARCGAAALQSRAEQSNDLQIENPAPCASTRNMDVFYEKHTGMASAIIWLCWYKCHNIRIEPDSQKSQNTGNHLGEIANLQSFIYAGNFAHPGWPTKITGISDASKVPCMVSVCRGMPWHVRATGAAPQPAGTGYLCQNLANKLSATFFGDHRWKHTLRWPHCGPFWIRTKPKVTEAGKNRP